MNITTSYFGNIKNIKNPVAICARAPMWFVGPRYPTLAPTYRIFIDYKTNEDAEQYTKDFEIEVLDKLNPHTILKEMLQLYGEEFTMVCYEKPYDNRGNQIFCHRYIVARWFEKYIQDLKIVELEI